jgi:hypothetical protein
MDWMVAVNKNSFERGRINDLENNIEVEKICLMPDLKEN